MYCTILFFQVFCSLASQPAECGAKAVQVAASQPVSFIDWRITVEPLPIISLKRSTPTTDKEAKRIRELIKSLADIDSRDFGLSPAMRLSVFLPLAETQGTDALLPADHRLQTSKSLRELVKSGPEAIPFLLESLTDDTPTQLTITPNAQARGELSFGNEVYCWNPANPEEAKALPLPGVAKRSQFPKEIKSYTIKIGDVCLVPIGQIFGRVTYNPIRGMRGSASIVIISPTSFPEISNSLREAWSSNDSRAKLLHSLLLDYSARGIFNGVSLDEWSNGSKLQVGAALRLLYYFPEETAPLIAKRLKSLDVLCHGWPAKGSFNRDQLAAEAKREVANGVRTKDFIKAVAWSDLPEIREAIMDIARRSDDSEILDVINKSRR